MKIAVLFTKRDEIAKSYHGDWEGRDINDDAYSVIDALKELGHEASVYHVDLGLFERLRKDKDQIDMVFNLCDDGFFSDSRLEPHLPAILDVIKIPYTGGNYLTLALTLKKGTVKKILDYHGIPTPNFQVFRSGDEELKDLDFPLIVKPAREDASIGIKDDSVVGNEEELRKKVKQVIADYRQPAIVEEFIEGREFNVGVIGNGEVLPLSEITFDSLPEGKPRIVNYAAKWKEDSVDYKATKRRCPAEVDEELGSRLRTLALKAASLFGCRDYFRVDFRVKDNKPYILEVNQNPDISEDAGLFAMARAKGYSYSGMVAKILESAIERYRKDLKRN
ncbi:ATP-grasp domain-containing protein [Candidatus Woesearchaeota archaeon]|nr:ATP-grasp domain-containing protein [Candidatus Woesearchaeota archaeon]